MRWIISTGKISAPQPSNLESKASQSFRVFHSPVSCYSAAHLIPATQLRFCFVFSALPPDAAVAPFPGRNWAKRDGSWNYIRGERSRFEKFQNKISFFVLELDQQHFSLSFNACFNLFFIFSYVIKIDAPFSTYHKDLIGRLTIGSCMFICTFNIFLLPQ